MKHELLSQAEVDELPDGARVIVIWSGGNGPHEYEICRRNGDVCVKNIYTDRLDFVGKTAYHTRVERKQ